MTRQIAHAACPYACPNTCSIPRRRHGAGRPAANIRPHGARSSSIGAIDTTAEVTADVIPVVTVIPIGHWTENDGSTVPALNGVRFADIGHALTFCETRAEVVRSEQLSRDVERSDV